MRFHSLDDWLTWQATLNPSEIELGLERVLQVRAVLALDKIAGKVITVAGTNGKGSTVAAYETWLHQSGYTVASYTSPHLLRYNERIRLNRGEVTDEILCRAFARVDQARGDIPLTYFEFGTLAALLIIADQCPDYAILEVGLGGRLDAVNVIDPDLAHITMIGLDHQAWLGETRDQIGREKAGILRPQVLAICNDSNPPASVLESLTELQCRSLCLGREYDYSMVDDRSFQWRSGARDMLITSPLPGEHQAINLSGVLAGLQLLDELDGLSQIEVNLRFANLICPGRLQEIASALRARLITDVGHNVDAARVIAAYLNARQEPGRVIVLLGMLKDKDQTAFMATLRTQVDEWWYLSLSGERGLAAAELAELNQSVGAGHRLFDTADAAMAHAMSCLKDQDILLVTGSFMTVEAVLRTDLIEL